ncbi:tripartite tricarboxylate transporter TctB family protein [Christensenellaceae bacterium OttesenSCG-928-L17]|nr:tripartite tricarboxylate transporter TctB family protein [Christensenellaceae bacterium OttesenSCG-928-L17]
MNETQTEHSPHTPPMGEGNEKSSAPAQETPARPGKTVFAAALCLLAGVCFFFALKLYVSMEPPRAASAGALPLIASGLFVVLSCMDFVRGYQKRAPKGERESYFALARRTLLFVFPRDVLVLLAGVIAYCVLLLCNVNFYIVTTLFLYGGMCYFTRGNYVKNAILTGAVMLLVWLLFDRLFGVVFP